MPDDDAISEPMPLKRGRFPAGLAVGLVLIGVGGLLSLRGITRVNESAQLLEHTHEVIAHSEDLLLALADIESESRGYIVTSQPTYLQRLDAAKERLPEELSHVRDRIAGKPDQQARLQHIEGVLAALVQFAEEVVRLQQTDAPVAAALVRTGQGTQITDTARQQIDEFQKAEQQRLAQRQVELRNAQRVSFALTSGTAVIGMLLVAISGGLAARENRRRAEADAALRESARKLAAAVRDYERVMDHSLDVICTIDDEGRFVSVSRACEWVWGYRPEELIGCKYMDLVFPEDREKTILAATDIMAGRAAHGFENRYIRKDGSLVCVLWTAAWSPADKLNFSVARDITERKRADDELRRAKAAAEEASRAKSQFLANMSHELRTPLNSIIGFSEILEDQTFGPLNPKQARYVGNVLSSGRHLLQLINDILDLAKVEAGRMELQPEDFASDRAVEDVLAVVKALAHKKNITLATEFAPGVPQLRADQSKFKQVLYNLLSNAVKFTLDGGIVTTRLEVVHPNGAATGAVLRVVVTDTGIGLKPADIGRLFREFEQIDSTYARQQSGTGLGLALTKKIVELHGGRIWAASDGEGRGSTFTFELPLVSAAAAETAIVVPAESDMPRSLPGQPLVLVVEDDERAMSLLANHLHAGGYDVAHARTGAQALEIARTTQPFAITMDILLPDRPGWEVLRELKADVETRDVPVVIVSITDDKQLGYSLGALDFLVKPVSREQLLAAIARAGRAAGKAVRTVLIVDDEPASVEPLAEALNAGGYTVIEARSGAEGLAATAKRLPDLMILDLLMPGMNGFEVVERLRTDARTAELPVLIYTSKDLTTDERAQLTRQVQGITAKPAKDQLLAELDRLAATVSSKDGRGEGI